MRGCHRDISAKSHALRPFSVLFFTQHVASSLSSIAIRHSVIQSYALLHKTCTKHWFCIILKFAHLVDICVCRDFDRIIWGFERDTVASCLRRKCQDGRGAGQTCHSDDCQCELRCGGGGYAKGQCNVRSSRRLTVWANMLRFMHKVFEVRGQVQWMDNIRVYHARKWALLQDRPAHRRLIFVKQTWNSYCYMKQRTTRVSGRSSMTFGSSMSR
jgi:hypothetical protein